MSKPFLSIEEQVALLNRRGMTTSERTPRILLREGYYSVVNGYKDPFIDKKASALARDDRYKAGSDFDSLYQLFVFDRELRELTFHHLLLAEATARTAIAYSFSEVHREPDAYLLQSSFCTKKEYELIEHKKSYARELSKLISTLRYRATKSTAKFIEHYRELHGEVPLWVLANDLTF